MFKVDEGLLTLNITRLTGFINDPSTALNLSCMLISRRTWDPCRECPWDTGLPANNYKNRSINCFMAGNVFYRLNTAEQILRAIEARAMLESYMIHLAGT